MFAVSVILPTSHPTPHSVKKGSPQKGTKDCKFKKEFFPAKHSFLLNKKYIFLYVHVLSHFSGKTHIFVYPYTHTHTHTHTHTQQSFPAGASSKEPARQCRRCGFDPWVREIPWRRPWQPTPVFLPGESHGERSLAGYSPWGHKDSDKTEVTNTRSFM